MQDNVTEIKNQLNIIDVVRSYVPTLKKQGHIYKGLCPFHKEKTPSFTVSEDKQLWYCFGCSEGGDVIRFVEKVENIDFQDAIELLADRAGIELKKSTAPHTSKDEKNKFFEINQKAQNFFTSQLKANQKALEYLKERQITDQTITDFGLGYAPNEYQSLNQTLKNASYKERDILLSSLATQREIGAESYDKFRGRIMFPITDRSGNTIAFGGRQLDGPEPKYLNSSETPIYHKSNVLYALSHAKQGIKTAGHAVIVEGYFDAISSHQGGEPTAVAPCGTALTIEQLRELKKYTKKIIFAFDTDKAGQNATAKAITLGAELEVEFFVAQVPNGKDPDDFIKANPEAWKSLIVSPTPAWDWICAYTLNNHDQTNPKGKKNIIADLAEFLTKLPSPIDQEHYVKDLAQKISTTPEIITKEIQRKAPKIKKQEQPTTAKKCQNNTSEDYLLGFIMNQPDLAQDLDGDFLPLGLLKNACNYLQKSYTKNGKEQDSASLDDSFSPEEKQKAQIMALITLEKYQSFNPTAKNIEYEKIKQRVYERTKKHYITLLTRNIETSENSGDTEKTKTLKKSLQNLFHKFRKLNGKS